MVSKDIVHGKLHNDKKLQKQHTYSEKVINLEVETMITITTIELQITPTISDPHSNIYTFLQHHDINNTITTS